MAYEKTKELPVKEAEKKKKKKKEVITLAEQINFGGNFRKK